MRYKRTITEAVLYLILVVAVFYWHQEKILSFLTDDRFLDILTESAITLSGIGVGLIGIILVLPQPAGIKGEISTEVKRTFLSRLKRSTTYFLLSSFSAFLSYAVPRSPLITVAVCSAISTILFLNGLLHLLYVCLTIEKVSSN